MHSRLIVAATDFTPAAAAAARRGAELARVSGSRLALLHAGAEGAREPLRLSAARLGALAGTTVEPHLAAGPVPEALSAYAKTTRADLIVVGNRQAGFLADLLRLDTASRVRRRASIPVLAVSRAARRPYRRVLLASDLSPSSAHAGRAALRLLPGAEMHVLHVSEPLYQGSLHFAGVDRSLIAHYRRQTLLLGERELSRFAADWLPGAEPRTQVRLGAPAAGIREHAREIDADVLILAPSRSWLLRVSGGSVTERLLADPPCDILLAG